MSGQNDADPSQDSNERSNLSDDPANRIDQEMSLEEIGTRLWNVNLKQRRVGRSASYRSASSLEELSAKLQENLIEQVEELLDRLYAYLSCIPENTEEQDESSSLRPNAHTHTGLSLPATAIGLISSLLKDDDVQQPNAPSKLSGIEASLSTATIQRISLLQFHLGRIKHLRITADPWPKKHKVHSESRARRRREVDQATFLRDYDRMVYRPVVDLSLFPSVMILFLDQTPPEWIYNLCALKNSLHVIRVERSCIHKLSSFLGPTDPLERQSVQPLEEEQESEFSYSKLTHVRFSYCSIGETSGLKGERVSDGGHSEPPLSWCPQALSLSLAHNQLRTEAAALAGVSRMSRLDKLDLSYNFLTTLKYAHYRLGNVKVLVLSHNQIRSVTGIDRLVALQTLRLDHNDLSDLASVSGVARLPDLNELSLIGNPFQMAHPKRYRVSVLDLFRERRFKQLPERATFLDMQQMLPTLDGTTATIKELKALRNRTFRPLNGIPAVITVQNDGVLVIPTRPRRRRIAAIDAHETKKHRRPQLLENGTPTSTFTVVDVLLSLCEADRDPPKSPLEIRETSDGEDDVSIRDDESDVPFLGDVVEPIESRDFTLSSFIHDVENVGSKSRSTTVVVEDLPQERNTDISLELQDEELITQLGEEGDNSAGFGGHTLSPIKLEDEVTQSLKASAITAATAADTESHADEGQGNFEKVAVWNQEVAADTTIDDQTSDVPETPTILSPNHMFLSVNPENVWRDDSSVPSSIATPLRDDTTLHMRLQQAEANSIFDGPELYKRLSVHDNLELYFRLFVFSPSDTSSHPSSLDTSFGMEKQLDVTFMPRIQIWPVDIRKRDASGLDLAQVPNEQLRRLWKERVVACGKPALRRLTPNLGARYGFHGELLWSEASSSHLKPDTLAENREVILCCSNYAFYIIADHDTVSAKLIEQKRRFPLPIPKDAVFGDAKWPHAMARHPFESLKRIVIGFGFQRLTLCFSDVTGNEYTYILLLASKEETVSLLKELQELVNEAREGPGIIISSEAQIIIENDDRHVLDSMGIAVAPDIVGTVLHYQLLHQRWKHGDRGLVRRVCLVTDTKLFLLDEDFTGDGSVSIEVNSQHTGESSYRLVDAADLRQIAKVQAADADPNAITIMISPKSRLQRPHNWRLVCRNRQGAEKLVDDVRKAISLSG